MNKDYDILTDEQRLSQFLERERKKNVTLLRKYYPKMDDADINGIYQDACIALFTNIQSGKLTTFTCLPTTYFTQICLYRASKLARDSKKAIVFNPDMKEHNQSDEDGNSRPDYDTDRINDLIDEDEPGLAREAEIIRALVKILPAPCEQILWAFYGKEKKSMTEIARMVNYNNADTAKVKKSQCLSKLKKTISEAIKVSAKDLDKHTHANLSEFIVSFKDVKIEEDGKE